MSSGSSTAKFFPPTFTQESPCYLSSGLYNTQIIRVCRQLTHGIIPALNCPRTSHYLAHHVSCGRENENSKRRKSWVVDTVKGLSKFKRDTGIHTPKQTEIV